MTGIALLVALATPIATPVPQQAGVCPNATRRHRGRGLPGARRRRQRRLRARHRSRPGLEAMRVAGIAYQTAQRFPGFVCRIAGQPANDPCVNTSPASAYWAYWIAAPGGSWCYSTFGAGSRRPPPGTFEGWSFALDRTAAELPPPRFDPPPLPAGAAPITLNASDCTSTPRPPASEPLRPRRPPFRRRRTVTADAPPPTTAPTTTRDVRQPRARRSPHRPGLEPTAGRDERRHHGTTTPTDEAVAAGTVDLGEDGGGGGSAIGFVASAAVVVGLGTAAALIARRRRLRGGA